jgi:hypothetical protein
MVEMRRSEAFLSSLLCVIRNVIIGVLRHTTKLPGINLLTSHDTVISLESRTEACSFL